MNLESVSAKVDISNSPFDNDYSPAKLVRGLFHSGGGLLSNLLGPVLQIVVPIDIIESAIEQLASLAISVLRRSNSDKFARFDANNHLDSNQPPITLQRGKLLIQRRTI